MIAILMALSVLVLLTLVTILAFDLACRLRPAEFSQLDNWQNLGK